MSFICKADLSYVSDGGQNIAFSVLYLTTTVSYFYLSKVIGRMPISPQKDCLEVPLGKGYLMPEVV
jgi:hypothetical protein